MRRETIADMFRESEFGRGQGYLPGVWEDAVCWVMGECVMPAVPLLLAGCVCLAVCCWVVIAVGVCRGSGSEPELLPTGAGSDASLPAGGEVRPGERERQPVGSVAAIAVEAADVEDDVDVLDRFDSF